MTDTKTEEGSLSSSRSTHSYNYSSITLSKILQKRTSCRKSFQKHTFPILSKTIRRTSFFTFIPSRDLPIVNFTTRVQFNFFPGHRWKCSGAHSSSQSITSRATLRRSFSWNIQETRIIGRSRTPNIFERCTIPLDTYPRDSRERVNRAMVEVTRAKDLFPPSCMHLACTCAWLSILAFDFRYYRGSNQHRPLVAYIYEPHGSCTLRRAKFKQGCISRGILFVTTRRCMHCPTIDPFYPF